MKEVEIWTDGIIASVEKAVFGKREIIERVIVALLCRGHVLIEDVPGVGKTVLARAVAKSIGGDFKQIQCTADLLPSDVLGVSVYHPKTGEFHFKQGPVITNFLLVDEINRATPRTQSALLEAMAEGQVSIEGRSMSLPDPFFLMATQSPVESEGTFPLPEVQKDRFFLSLSVGYPDRAAEIRVMTNQRADMKPVETISAVTDTQRLIAMQEKVISVHADDSIKSYILRIIKKTRTDDRLLLGVSPRGSLALFKGAQALAAIRGRDYLVPEDVKDIAHPVLAQRILVKPGFSAGGLTAHDLVDEILTSVEVPGYKEAG
ncbi:MAG: MoxR family ATPase [Spirochaetales bacterium]|nr:MoxR family ATPase [Spirochaetales bacterium]